MNDQELDILLSESAKRQQSVNQINATVMRTVRRDLRLKIVRKWAKLLGLCFGIPLALVVYIFVLNEAMSVSAMQTPLQIICVALPLVTIGLLLATKLRNFRIDLCSLYRGVTEKILHNNKWYPSLQHMRSCRVAHRMWGIAFFSEMLRRKCFAFFNILEKYLFNTGDCHLFMSLA